MKPGTKTAKPTRAAVAEPAVNDAAAEAEAPDAQAAQTDSPLLDLSDAAVKRRIKAAKARGYVTYDELNSVLPSEEVSSEQIEDTMAMLADMGINVVDSEEEAEEAAPQLDEVPEGGAGRR